MTGPVSLSSLILSGLLVLSGLFWGCADDSPVVKETEEEPQLPEWMDFCRSRLKSTCNLLRS